MTAPTRSSPRKPGRAKPVATAEERARKRLELRRSATDVYRRAILEAAERVFVESSFADAKIADIAREAGMATGSIYTYFASKEQIFQSLLELRGEELLGQLDAGSRAPAAPLDRLEAVVRTSLAHVEEHRSMFVLFTELGEGQVMRLAGHAAQRRYDRFVGHYERAMREAVVAGVIRRDVQVADLVALLTGAMKGYVQAWMSAGGRKGLAVKAGTVLDVFVRGAGARS
jgi:TetR/AcrR family transcriptional regulator, fatty acid metabolism regulator protein